MRLNNIFRKVNCVVMNQKPTNFGPNLSQKKIPWCHADYAKARFKENKSRTNFWGRGRDECPTRPLGIRRRSFLALAILCPSRRKNFWS